MTTKGGRKKPGQSSGPVEASGTVYDTRQYARLVSKWIAALGWTRTVSVHTHCDELRPPDLPTHGICGRTASARPYQDRKHRQVS